MRRTALMKSPKTLWHISYTSFFKNGSKIQGDTTFTIRSKSCSEKNINYMRDWIKDLNPENSDGSDIDVVIIKSITKMS